jgi:hypothetical protein
LSHARPTPDTSHSAADLAQEAPLRVGQDRVCVEDDGAGAIEPVWKIKRSVLLVGNGENECINAVERGNVRDDRHIELRPASNQRVMANHAIEASGWKGERGAAIISRPETRSFYTEVSRWAARNGWLRLAFLRLDGRALAFQCGLEDGGTHYFLKGGFRQRVPPLLAGQDPRRGHRSGDAGSLPA